MNFPQQHEAAAKPLVNPVRRQARNLWCLAFAVLALTVAVTAYGGAVRAKAVIFFALGCGGVFGLIVALVALILPAATAAAMDRELAAMQRGDCLAHWRYEPDEWRLFAEADWRRTRGDAAKAFFLFAVTIAVLIGGLMYFLTGVGKVFLFCGLIGLAVAALMSGSILFVGWLRYRHNRRTVGEAYLGVQSVYLNGAFWTWNRWGGRLDSIKWLDTHPTMLELTIRWGMPPQSHHERKVRIPIPADRLDEAREVVEQWGRGRPGIIRSAGSPDAPAAALRHHGGRL